MSIWILYIPEKYSEEAGELMIPPPPPLLLLARDAQKCVHVYSDNINVSANRNVMQWEELKINLGLFRACFLAH
jgi:hypothetical protein